MTAVLERPQGQRPAGNHPDPEGHLSSIASCCAVIVFFPVPGERDDNTEATIPPPPSRKMLSKGSTPRQTKHVKCLSLCQWIHSGLSIPLEWTFLAPPGFGVGAVPKALFLAFATESTLDFSSSSGWDDKQKVHTKWTPPALYKKYVFM